MEQHALLIVMAVVILIVAAGLLAWYSRQHRSEHLRKRFGPEYNRAVAQMKDQRQAEAELARREKRVNKLHLRALSAPDRQRFASVWLAAQSRFVDDPAAAVAEAECLLREVMQARGYPQGDYEEVTAYVSVDHPQFVQNYREAHDIALRCERGEATTEQLRQAIVHYRTLFNDLLETQKAA